MSPGGLGHLKSPAPGRTRSVSDSSAPRTGNCPRGSNCPSVSFLLTFDLSPSEPVAKTSTPAFAKNGKSAGQQGSPWETLVVFAINLKQLIVQMNMSNVMGNNT